MRDAKGAGPMKGLRPALRRGEGSEARPQAVSPATPQQAVHIAARIGRLLLANGTGTMGTQRRVGNIMRALGHEARVLVTLEALIIAYSADGRMETRLGREIPGMGVDMGRLVTLKRIDDGVCSGSLSLDEANARLDALEAGGHGHAGWLVVVGVAVTAASLARLFGASWAVMGASFIAGAVSTVLRRAFAARHVNPIGGAFAVAVISGFAGALAIRFVPGASPVLCLTAAGMILVPGVPLINGVRDIVDGHIGNGVARLAFGTATVLALGFALFLAAALAGDTLPVEQAGRLLPIPQDIVFSATAAAGFSMLFNVPFRAVGYCVLCGVASHSLRTALAHLGLDLASGSLIGAAVAGVIAVLAARAHHVPPVTFAFPGTVAMIPGSFGFRAGIGALHIMAQGAAAPPTLVAGTLSLAIATAIMTAAIGIGLSLALSVMPAPISA